MNLRSTPPWWNASFESERANEATKGNSDRTRMNRTVGQMNSQRAVPSERHAPRAEIARRGARGAGRAARAAGRRGAECVVGGGGFAGLGGLTVDGQAPLVGCGGATA